MNQHYHRFRTAALLSAPLVLAVVVATLTLLPGLTAERAVPDRDDTRLERVIDVQLPTL